MELRGPGYGPAITPHYQSKRPGLSPGPALCLSPKARAQIKSAYCAIGYARQVLILLAGGGFEVPGSLRNTPSVIVQKLRTPVRLNCSGAEPTTKELFVDPPWLTPTATN